MSQGCVLVTGGARGIGAGICRRLGADGYRTVVLDIAEPEAGAADAYYAVDLADAGAADAAFARAARDHAPTRLVNNVGVVRPATLEETDADGFDRVLGLNARAALLGARALLPAMRRAGFGRIVSITSRVVLGKQLRTAYAASKGALAAMTRTWALELAGDGITIVITDKPWIYAFTADRR